jgi:hypothetical protein
MQRRVDGGVLLTVWWHTRFSGLLLCLLIDEAIVSPVQPSATEHSGRRERERERERDADRHTCRASIIKFP